MTVTRCAGPDCEQRGTDTLTFGAFRVKVCPYHADCVIRFTSAGVEFDCDHQQIREAETARLAAQAQERAAKKLRRETRAAQRG